MIFNYIKISLRSLLKRQVFSAVNLLGLTLGLLTFLVLFAYVGTEWTFNDFHENKDEIYRIAVIESSGQAEILLPPGFANILEDQFTDLDHVTRAAGNIGNGLISIPELNIAFKEEEISFVEGDFFQTFSFSIQRGNADLSEPQTAVISNHLANKLFGDSDALGKSFTISNNFGKNDFTVTGVLDEIPLRSDLSSQVFLSIHFLENEANRNGNTWADPDGMDSGFANLYVQTNPGIKSEKLADQITNYFKRFPGLDEIKVHLQPLSEWHLGRSIDDPLPTFGSRASVLVFAAMAILILAIAYVNYLNLSAASILTRLKEIKMRKVLGANSWQVGQQFMIETLILLVFSAVLALVGVYLLEPIVAAILGKSIWLGALTLPVFWLMLMGIIGFCSLISGIYVVVLSGKFAKKSQVDFKAGRGQLLQKSLVVFQFVISIGIIISTLVIRDQLSFMQNKDLGMNLEQLLVISGPNELGENRQEKLVSFKDRLTNFTFVKGLAASNVLPGRSYNFSAGGITPMVPRPEDRDQSYAMGIIDEKFLDIYEIEIKAGRGFNPNETKVGWYESGKLMINESASRVLGFDGPESAAGNDIKWGEDVYEIVGVVEDYHHLSLKEEILPMILLPNEGQAYFSLIVDPTNLESNLASLQSTFEEIFPGNPFEYYFMDEQFAAQYAEDRQLSKTFTIAGVLSILISCLGLFGLAAYTVEQRTKEIGIRKVLGASSKGVIKLITKDFVLLVFVAIIIAFPLAWYGMNTWQSDFPYQAGLSLWTFLLGGLITLLIAFFTVGTQALRAAWSNPVDAMRDE
ncbi:ABC transporter permease [Algoriphagus sediminis]|uniref:ABC transporter permease n=1 Tax=Algoriphagus sediminis TaxID=3057113 RepID=A0ABT7Y9X8_9BACT|nr:ABC transporter permease [Algoriphagus sediminis]MDN3203316.1 ABC transporter permease [Algoriphagus sediminis]